MFFYINNLEITFTIMQSTIPTTVGVNNAIRDHLLLLVSFFIVSSVVEQGQ